MSKLHKTINHPVLVCCLLLLTSSGWAFTADTMVRVCPVDGLTTQPHTLPDFLSCDSQPLGTLDPQHRLLWLEIRWQPTAPLTMPLGLFISGKQSSHVYLNGQWLGDNGQPGMTATEEQPGLIDAVIHIPTTMIQAGENRWQILMSAHHGWLTLSHPIHRIFVAPHHRPANAILRHYWPSLLPFGVLVLGLFYLALMAWFHRLPKRAWLLPLMAFWAAGQLFVEVSRGVMPYLYPWQDLRLLVILWCSVAFACSLFWYVLMGLKLRQPGWHGLLFVGVLVVLVWQAPGFDSKSLLVILWAVLAALVYLLRAVWTGVSNQWWLLWLLVGFLATTFISVYSFIDTVYYYYVALLIFVLMAQQVRQARDQQLEYRDRARQLQRTITHNNRQAQPQRLAIRSAGKTEWLALEDLAYCQGAGDYVELVDVHGGVKLYHGSLTQLSQQLPDSFLKTHRSYWVNTALIQSLQRSPSGVGRLLLSNGAEVPVSKRILPHLKEKLA